MTIINKYFSGLTANQKNKFLLLINLYQKINENLNLISRKDIDNLELNHILHSLSIAKVINFRKHTKILDVGTGGGLPGIPLAILFPEVQFLLIDSTGKKINAVKEIISELNLDNITAEKIRSNDLKQKFDFITSRAVTNFPKFVDSVKHCIHNNDKNALPNGILYLKGGNFDREISLFKKQISVYELKDYFDEDFFETKKLIYYSA